MKGLGVIWLMFFIGIMSANLFHISVGIVQLDNARDIFNNSQTEDDLIDETFNNSNK